MFNVTNVSSFRGRPVEKPEIVPEKTVAILGSSKETLQNKLYIDMSRGYNVVTGGNYGTMKAANDGAWEADPSKSWAVNVTEWIDDHKEKIFNVLAEVKTGAARTDLFKEIAKYWVVFPGGPGSLQELAVGGESKYYNAEHAPEKIILVGKKFHKPLFDYLKNMDQFGVAKNAASSYILADTKEEILSEITGQKLNLVA